MNFIKLSFLLLTSSSILSCSNGSDSSGGDGTNAETGVRVLHAAIDAAPVALYSSSEPGQLLGTANFAAGSHYIELSGAQTLSLTATNNSAEVFFNVAASIEDEQRKSLLVYGTRESGGFNVALLDDPQPEIESGSALVRVVNGIKGSNAVDVEADGLSLASSLPVAQGAAYVAVTPGAHQINARAHVNNRTLVNASHNFIAGKAYTIFLSGESGYLALETLLED